MLCTTSCGETSDKGVETKFETVSSVVVVHLRDAAEKIRIRVCIGQESRLDRNARRFRARLLLDDRTDHIVAHHHHRAHRVVGADGRLKGNTQCAYILALKFNLLPADVRPKAAQYLAEDIKAKGDHLSTGFVGVSFLLPVLTQADKTELAYRLLQQDTFPSWLFSVKQGATTIWERWDGWTPDKGFQDPGMNSFNHYSLGSCGEYLFGYIGGIRPSAPGFKSILIEPMIRDGLSWAKTTYTSIHGPISTFWKRTDKHLELDVVVPANTTASICLPATDVATVTESGKRIGKTKGVTFLRAEGENVWLEAGSGTYKFASNLR